ncbi:transglutaminase [Nocardia transvalensis]|nr:transglutaminase [Nocardia transvalensis]
MAPRGSPPRLSHSKLVLDGPRVSGKDAYALDSAREPSRRVIGTCRHFAVISCALLRYRGIASRVRCGFATYFQPGQGLDHWITEYWDDTEGRWVRIDSEILGQSVLEHPEDLGAGEFLSGGEAWAAFRDGRIDASTFGVYGTENWGPAEIRGNAIKDLAALNKVETLPWDEWGRMTASYNGETGRDYDELLDTIAAICSHGDTVALTELYARDELCVPAELVR